VDKDKEDFYLGFHTGFVETICHHI